jgi:hypothetical protein
LSLLWRGYIASSKEITLGIIAAIHLIVDRFAVFVALSLFFGN